MTNVMLEILDGFSSVWVLIYWHSFKVCVSTSDFKFLIKVNIGSGYSNSSFAHSFDFYCHTNFAIRIDLWWMVSLGCELLCKLSIYTLKSDQWLTIWWAKFELECLLLIFIYFHSEFKVSCKTETLNAGTSELKKN